MNCAEESHEQSETFNSTKNHFRSLDLQSSLDMYEMYGPDKDHPEIPFLKNPVIGLVKAVSNPHTYPGAMHLADGDALYNQGKYEQAIKKYILNIYSEIYTLTDHEWQSYIGIAKCYLKNGDIASSINFLHRAFLFYERIDKKPEKELTEYKLFHDIIRCIKLQYKDDLKNISNSLDKYEFIGNLLNDKSGWNLALSIVEFILKDI